MNLTLKNKWLAALRSGEYKQGKSALRSEPTAADGVTVEGPDKFCCLGVLCDIVEPNQWRSMNHEWRNGAASEDGGMPRAALQEKLGLNKPCTRVRHSDSIAEKLAAMNDNGKTFEEIANWIEKRSF